VHNQIPHNSYNDLFKDKHISFCTYLNSIFSFIQLFSFQDILPAHLPAIFVNVYLYFVKPVLDIWNETCRGSVFYRVHCGLVEIISRVRHVVQIHILLLDALHHGSVKVPLIPTHINAWLSESPKSYIRFSRQCIYEVTLLCGPPCLGSRIIQAFYQTQNIGGTFQ
jgi:hypothetical protein